jgi:archaellum component FlaD/FlaE
MPEILGKELKEDAQYLDTCRQKRNIAEYNQIGVISETEAEELLKFTKVITPTSFRLAERKPT